MGEAVQSPRSTRSREPELLSAALDSLRVHGVEARVFDAPDPVEVRVELAWRGHRRTYAVAVQQSVRPSSLALAVDRVRSLGVGVPVLLVTGTVSAETGRLLRDRGIAFVDAAGNAWLDTPDFLIAVSGERGAAPRPAADHVGVAALQVAFVLLRDPASREMSVRALGERAGVSHGAAAAAVNAFDARGWVRKLGRAGQRVVDPEGLLTAWIVGFGNQLGPRLQLARATSPGAASTSAWAAGVATRCSPESGMLGGEAAAELANHDIHGATASVWVRAWDVPAMQRLRLVPAADGRIVVRRAFAPVMHDPDDDRLVDPLIVLAEIASLPDERLDGTRAAIRTAVTARIPG